jgi:hypothetical protein
MKEQFDSNAIAKLGWRQGAILGDKLAVSALHHAPVRSPAEDDGWLIVTSHDCDVVNFSIEKEPVVEVACEHHAREESRQAAVVR